MGLAEGRNAGVTGIIDLPGQGAKFSVWVLGFSSDLQVNMIPDGGRGDGEWPPELPLSSTGILAVGGNINLLGWPAPTSFRGEPGTLVTQLHTGATITYYVRVVGESFKKQNKEQGNWGVTLSCKIISAPTLAGFAGTQPAADIEAFGDKIVWDGLSTTIDPLGLQSGATRRLRVYGVVDADTDEATKIDEALAAITAPYTGMKVRTGTFTRLSKSVGYIDVALGLTTTAEDIINPATQTTIDPSGLQSQATSAAINGTAPTPSTAPYTAGSWVVRSRTTRELNDGNDLETAEFGERSTESDIEYPGTPTETEASNIGDSARITQVTTSSTPPSAPAAPVGLLTKSSSVRQDDGHWIHAWEYGNSTRAESIAYDGTRIEYDPSFLKDGGTITVLDTDSTPPSTPSAPVADTKLRARYTQRIQTTPEKWKHTFEYARRTTEDDAEMGGSKVRDCPSDLGDRTELALVQTSATPSAPGTPSGLVLYDTLTDQLDDGHWLHTFIYARNTRKEEIERDGTHARASGTDAAITITRTIIDSASSPATYRASLLTGGGSLHLDPTFEELDVTQLTAGKLQKTLVTRENVRTVRARALLTGQIPTIAYFEPYTTTLTDPNVFLVDRYQVSATQWVYVLGEHPCPFPVATMELAIRFRYATAGALPHNGSILGTYNSDTFLGLPIGRVSYMGIDVETIVTTAGDNSGSAQIAYIFHADGRGIVNVSQFPIGVKRYTTTDITALVPGTWVAASDLGITYAAAPMTGTGYTTPFLT